jgi:hypothetical protein
MAPRQLQALLSFGLTFHEQLSDLSSGRLRNSNQAEVQSGRSRWLARGLPPRLIKSLNRYFAFRGPTPTHRSDLARSARLSAQSDFHGSPVALLQALLAYRLDMAHAAACDHLSPLFDDVAQLDDFAQQLETLMEGDFVDNPELVLPLANGSPHCGTYRYR